MTACNSQRPVFSRHFLELHAKTKKPNSHGYKTGRATTVQLRATCVAATPLYPRTGCTGCTHPARGYLGQHLVATNKGRRKASQSLARLYSPAYKIPRIGHFRLRLCVLVHSAFIGPKRTSLAASHMSAFGGKADIMQTCGELDVLDDLVVLNALIGGLFYAPQLLEIMAPGTPCCGLG
jgi:hypothetical protein